MDLVQHITLETANIGGTLVHDYLMGSKTVQPLYQFSPNISGLREAVEKRREFKVNRPLLYEVLHRQHGKSFLSEVQKENIELLLQENSFTVTTGHQLNLFTGPLYFIYKIASIISLTNQLRNELPGHHFIPVYWMNSEDHDFEEINHFFLNGAKFEWVVKTNKYGPVGKMELESIQPLIEEIQQKFGEYYKEDPIFQFIIRAYIESKNLADAHREIVNKIFNEYGLLILDQDDAELKAEFSNVISDEIFEKSSIKQVESTNAYLESNGYKPQVFAREINFFYTGDGFRERIVETINGYGLADQSITWTKEELGLLIKSNPQSFSPNVVTRPMYQEFTLPNIAYVGGPAEVAYWLQYKSNFQEHHIFFPTLILRDCFLIVPEKKLRKVTELGCKLEDLFEPIEDLVNKYIRENHQHEMDVQPIIDDLNTQYQLLLTKVLALDPSMESMVKASHHKALGEIERIESKMNKALKLKHESQLNSIRGLHGIIFPGGGFQERIDNLFDHAKFTPTFVSQIVAASNCLDARLKVLND